LFLVELAGQRFDGDIVELAKMPPENETLVELPSFI
jgi:hypothetical protein